MNKITFFLNNFLGSLRDMPGSMSTKKLIAVLVAIVYAVTAIKFTNNENAVAMCTVHAGLIVSLIITHSVAKQYNEATKDTPPA